MRRIKKILESIMVIMLIAGIVAFAMSFFALKSGDVEKSYYLGVIAMICILPAAAYYSYRYLNGGGGLPF